VRSGDIVQFGARVGAVCGGAACGRARFDAVYEKEMMPTLDNVRVELCKDAGRVESCFLYKFVTRVSVKGEKGGETCKVDECGVHVRLVTSGRMSTSVLG
jgi:hypothetical protein